MTRTERNHADLFYAEILHAVEAWLHREACILFNIWYMSMFSDENYDNNDVENTVKELYAETENKCDGLIIIGKCTKGALDCLREYFKNVVSINRNPTGHQVDEVTCDGKKIAAIAVEHLIALGHTKIGYVGSCRGKSSFQRLY